MIFLILAGMVIGFVLLVLLAPFIDHVFCAYFDWAERKLKK